MKEQTVLHTWKGYRAFAMALAVVVLFFACAAGLAYGSDEHDDPDALQEAMELIAVLPADPDAVTEGDRADIEAAQKAYDALSAVDRQYLDDTDCDKNQTYGRWLESAQWALSMLQPVDNSTTLLDGDYSEWVSSTSSMGKSTSERGRKWNVVILTVSGGKAFATIRCDNTSAFRNLRSAGVDYTAEVVDGVPEFRNVPLAPNSTMYVTIDANAIADSIAYEITNTLPLDAASLDELASARSKADEAVAALTSAHTATDCAAVRAAADKVKAAAGKAGVTSIELKAAQRLLDDAVATANANKVVPAETETNKDQNSDSSKDKTKDKSKSKSKSDEDDKSGGGSSSGGSSSSGSGGSSAGANNAGSFARTGTTTPAAPIASAKKKDADDDALVTTEPIEAPTASGIELADEPITLPTLPVEGAIAAGAFLALVMLGIMLRSVLYSRAMNAQSRPL